MQLLTKECMDHLSAVTEVFQHAVREALSTLFITREAV